MDAKMFRVSGGPFPKDQLVRVEDIIKKDPDLNFRADYVKILFKADMLERMERKRLAKLVKRLTLSEFQPKWSSLCQMVAYFLNTDTPEPLNLILWSNGNLTAFWEDGSKLEFTGDEYFMEGGLMDMLEMRPSTIENETDH